MKLPVKQDSRVMAPNGSLSSGGLDLILRRRLWSSYIIYLILLALTIWFGGRRLDLPPEARLLGFVVGLALSFLIAAGPMLLTELVFIQPIRRRLRRLSDMVRTMDPSPTPPRVRSGDDIEAIRADLRRIVRRLDEARGDLVTRRIRAEADSSTDPLTHLYNHRSFNRFLAEEWDRARRARAPLALLILDIDRFKSFNDELGHLAGNQVLERVANLLKENVRTTDLIFRYAGDEFAALLPRTGLEQAVVVADKIRQRMGEQRMEIDGGRRELSVSVGVAEITPEMRSPEELVQLADRALYQSKEAGRNNVAYPAGRAVFRIYRPAPGEP